MPQRVLIMARTIHHLDDITVRTAKPRDDGGIRKLSDGGGLQMWVMPTGGKLWRLDYRMYGKRKLLALGAYPVVTLKSAREQALQAKRDIAGGVDPSAKKKAKKIAAERTFASIAALLIEKKRAEGKAEITIEKMAWILDKVKRDFGSRPIESITTPEVIVAMRREEQAGRFEAARRMRTVLGEVFRFAMQNGIVTSDPVHATKGAIARPKQRHHAAILDPKRFGELLRFVDNYARTNVLTGSALQLMAILYPRPGELRQAEWQEFDLDNARWSIPASRMKMRNAHVKPLPRQAVTILSRIKAITGPYGLVFPAVGRPGRPMSENTMNTALKRIGIPPDEHVPHGFRSSASTMLNDANKFSADAIEKELAHQDVDPVRRAYRRGEAMDERVAMAQWWADHLDHLRASNENAQ
jgi:integrase